MTTILIIEDDKITCEMYKKIIENHGYQVITAGNGQQGFELALQNHPDLILLDIKLPKLDGLTLLHNLRDDNWGKSAKVIVLTNYDPDDVSLKQIMVDQPTYYLLKVSNRPDTVVDKIKDLLENGK